MTRHFQTPLQLLCALILCWLLLGVPSVLQDSDLDPPLFHFHHFLSSTVTCILMTLDMRCLSWSHHHEDLTPSIFTLSMECSGPNAFPIISSLFLSTQYITIWAPRPPVCGDKPHHSVLSFVSSIRCRQHFLSPSWDSFLFLCSISTASTQFLPFPWSNPLSWVSPDSIFVPFSSLTSRADLLPKLVCHTGLTLAI